MSARAHVEHDWMRQMVRVAVRRETPGAVEAFIFAPATARIVEPSNRSAIPPEDEWLDLPEDAARAVYEALAEHFGHTGNDVRALRRDYDAERARVDKLISHVTGAQR